MKQSSKRLVSIAFALLFIVGALVFFFDLVQPAYSDFSNAKGQVAGEQTLLQTEQQSVTAAQALIAQYQNQPQSEQNLALAMPSGEDLAGALAQIYGLAAANGVGLQSIGIAAPTLASQPTSDNSNTSNSPVSLVQSLGTISLQLGAAGSYEALKSFLSGLETNIRIFDVKSISIEPASAGSKSAGQDFFTYLITVATYYQTNQATQTN